MAGLLVVVAGTVLAFGVVEGRFGSIRWTKVPRITVVSRAGDPRIAPLREAIAFWNRTFAQAGSPFRLGEATLVTGAVPDADVQALGRQVVMRPWWQTPPASVRRFPGDLVVILSEADFISYTARPGEQVIVAIKNENAPLLRMPNVLRNVIAHELGHAVGLAHNQDPALLMCGRPAACRPDAFRSNTPHFFPLSPEDRARLLALYPPSWTPRAKD